MVKINVRDVVLQCLFLIAKTSLRIIAKFGKWMTTILLLLKKRGMRMTRDQLCNEIAKRENKKVSVSIGNIREVVRVLIDLEVEFLNGSLTDRPIESSPIFVLQDEALKKAKKVEKKKGKRK
jgi:hypothetical protein